LRQRQVSKHAGLVEVLDRVVAARHVAVDRGIAHRDLGLVAGGQQHLAELVRQRHQQQAAQARLDVFLGDIPARCPFEKRRQRVGDRRAPLGDRHEIVAAAQRLGERLGILEEACEVYSEGSITQRTFSAPSASAAMVATSALSIPPDRPSSTFSKPGLAHVVAQGSAPWR
jgi:hypothetical protein